MDRAAWTRATRRPRSRRRSSMRRTFQARRPFALDCRVLRVDAAQIPRDLSPAQISPRVVP
jgi:hypothetical protein